MSRVFIILDLWLDGRRGKGANCDKGSIGLLRVAVAITLIPSFRGGWIMS